MEGAMRAAAARREGGVQITYKYVDGAHFFVSNDKDVQGLCVAHADLKIAYEEVARQLNILFEQNKGEKRNFRPTVPFEKFKKMVEAVIPLAELADNGGLITPSSIQPWMYDIER